MPGAGFKDESLYEGYLTDRDLIFLCVRNENRAGEREEFGRELERVWCTQEERCRSPACCRGQDMGCSGTSWEHSLLREHWECQKTLSVVLLHKASHTASWELSTDKTFIYENL